MKMFGRKSVKVGGESENDREIVCQTKKHNNTGNEYTTSHGVRNKKHRSDLMNSKSRFLYILGRSLCYISVENV